MRSSCVCTCELNATLAEAVTNTAVGLEPNTFPLQRLAGGRREELPGALARGKNTAGRRSLWNRPQNCTVGAESPSRMGTKTRMVATTGVCRASWFRESGLPRRGLGECRCPKHTARGTHCQQSSLAARLEGLYSRGIERVHETAGAGSAEGYPSYFFSQAQDSFGRSERSQAGT